ncbi:MAG: phenylacetic acid degradation protein [Saprospiraceae bacterium]|jgi:phenylacetic acid degradation protein|tara:strand:- start:538 stop:1134 length:597 start_codon:yes stop_codon:yes gene_type:complete
MIFEFKNFIPVVDESAYVHPQATVIGNVTIGKNVYIGPHAVIRGDWGEIIIKDGCNVQENCTVHMFPGTRVVFEEGAHVGHGAVIHGAHLGRNCMIGMNSVIMDNADVGEDSIIGAMAFVKANSIIPKRSLVVGNPAKVIKLVTDEMIAWKTKGTKLYQSLPADMHNTLKEVTPLRSPQINKPSQESLFATWNEIKSS